MTARCRSCGRRLRQPSPDGYGPACRRAARDTQGQSRVDVDQVAARKAASAAAIARLTSGERAELAEFEQQLRTKTTEQEAAS